MDKNGKMKKHSRYPYHMASIAVAIIIGCTIMGGSISGVLWSIHLYDRDHYGVKVGASDAGWLAEVALIGQRVSSNESLFSSHINTPMHPNAQSQWIAAVARLDEFEAELSSLRVELESIAAHTE